MTAHQQKQSLQQSILGQLLSLKLPKELVPYLEGFILDCNLHQLQNLNNNLPEVQKFIKLSIK